MCHRKRGPRSSLARLREGNTGVCIVRAEARLWDLLIRDSRKIRTSPQETEGAAGVRWRAHRQMCVWGQC